MLNFIKKIFSLKPVTVKANPAPAPVIETKPVEVAQDVVVSTPAPAPVAKPKKTVAKKVPAKTATKKAPAIKKPASPKKPKATKVH